MACIMPSFFAIHMVSELRQCIAYTKRVSAVQHPALLTLGLS